MTKNGKTINGLMKHIRNEHNISISGSKDKKDLLSMGYYHGYKAYKFLITENNKFKIEDFKEIKAIYNFDNSIKAILYSPTMKLETTLKNYAIDQVVRNKNPDINSIFATCLDHYKEAKNQKEYKKELKRVHILQSTFNNIIDSKPSPIIKHYIDKRKPVPIWAIFEFITLGDFGNFLLCLNETKRVDIENMIGISDKVNDTDGSMMPHHIFIIKDLRNAIAHNKVIFDCRFKTMNIKDSAIAQLELRTKIKDINFNSIVDYLILIMYYQKHLGETKTKMYATIKQFKHAIEVLKIGTKQSTFDTILGTNINNKIDNLIEYIRR